MKRTFGDHPEIMVPEGRRIAVTFAGEDDVVDDPLMRVVAIGGTLIP